MKYQINDQDLHQLIEIEVEENLDCHPLNPAKLGNGTDGCFFENAQYINYRITHGSETIVVREFHNVTPQYLIDKEVVIVQFYNFSERKTILISAIKT